MGQSMQKPSRSGLRNHNSRLSARSLQRSSNQSITQQKRASWSASKLRRPNQEENNDSSITPENAHIRNGELFIISRYDDQPPTIKQSNKFKIQRGSIGGDSSQLSPNFREIAETGVEYGLGPWGAVNTSKQSMEVSHGDVHHDITISFSKAKNNVNSPFHDDHEDRKSNLKQILEFEEQSQNQKSVEPVASPTIHGHQKYLPAQIDKISATRSIYSDNFNKPSTPANTPSEDGTPKKNRNSIEIEAPSSSKLKNTPKTQKKIQKQDLAAQPKSETKIQLAEGNGLDHTQYNDYDCADFKRKMKDGEGNKKAVKMSKKMEELKQKIVNKNNTSKDKEEILKGSIQRLSKSLRKFKGTGNSLESTSRDQSRDKLKPILSKVQCVDIKIESHTEIKPENKTAKKAEPIRTNKSPKQSLVEQKSSKKKDSHNQQPYLAKIRSSEQLGKTTNPSSKSNSRLNKNSKDIPTQLLVFNGGNTYVYQNLIIQNQKHLNDVPTTSVKKLEAAKTKEPSFTEMIKKEHFGNKLKKKGGDLMDEECLKYSQVEKGKQSPINQHFFASTCEGNKLISGQQYEFFDIRESKRIKESEPKINKQINSLKMITQQLAGKPHKSKLKVTLHEQSNNSSSQQQSMRNKTCQQKSQSLDRLPANLTTLNYNELIGNYEEYMLRDALNRQREGQQWAREEKKKHKSSEHSSKMTGKSRLLVF